MNLTLGAAIQIQAMMAEIESDMAAHGVDSDNDLHCSYITAQLELNSPGPDLIYVHNLLARALNKPLETRH